MRSQGVLKALVPYVVGLWVSPALAQAQQTAAPGASASGWVWLIVLLFLVIVLIAFGALSQRGGSGGKRGPPSTTR
jgi:hypothetical protein